MMRVQQESGDQRNDPLSASLLHTAVDPSKTSDLIERTWEESKKLWRIAGPSIFSRLAMFSVTTITQSLAGHLSDTDLAAISIVTTVLIAFTFGFLLGMASALETLCGQAYGAKRYALMGIHAQRSCVVLTFCAVLLLPIFVFAAPIARLVGQSEEVAARTGTAALWLVPFHLSLPFQFSLQRFLQSQVKAGAVAVISGVVLVVHVFLSWFFVYSQRVGIVGAALTIDLAWWLSTLGMFGYVILGGCPETWTGFSTEAFCDLWEFFKLSLASGIMLSLENFYYRMLIIVSGFFQDAHIAVNALSICISIYGWESMIPLGFLGSTGVRVANELGAGNAKAAKFATTVSILTSLFVGLLFVSIIILFHEKLALMFTSSLLVVEMVNKFSVMLSLTILVNSIAPVLSGVAVGSGWQATAAFVNMGSYYVVGLPLGLFCCSFLSFSIKGIWAGMISGTIVQTLVLSVITMRYEWEKEVEKVKMSFTKQGLILNP